MYQVGITGGIGSGKTLVCRVLETLGVPVYYADREARRLMNGHPVLRKGIDDLMPEIFFYTMPEEMEKQARSHGLSVLKNVGVDFVFNANVINEMGNRRFEAWLEVADFLFESPSCTGLSNHTVMVCQK